MFDEVMTGPQKAVAAAVATFVTSGATALLTAVQASGDGAGLGDLNTAAWLTVIIAALVSTGLVGGATYAVPNVPAAISYDDDYAPEAGDKGAGPDAPERDDLT